MKIEGHRGSSALYPENTMLAFYKAIEQGAQGIEIDVQKTSDGVYVIMHDLTVDRTTNGTGSVATLTSPYIATLDAGSWKDSFFTNRLDCKVPTLNEVLDLVEENDVYVKIQPKNLTTSDIDAIIVQTEARNLTYRTHVFSTVTIINYVKLNYPNYYCLNDGMPTISNYQTFLDNAVANDIDGVSISGFETFSNTTIMVENIKNSGKEVHISYLNSGYTNKMDFLIGLNVDMVLGDNVSEMVNAIYNYNLKYIKETSMFVKVSSGVSKVDLYYLRDDEYVSTSLVAYYK